jgi:predicted PurR-regulated permease PerM
VTAPASDPPLDRRRFSRIQVLEGVAATVLSAAVLGTAGGVGWLVIALPSEIKQIKTQIQQIVSNQNTFSDRFMDLEKQVNDHDRRIIRLEVR